MSTTKYARILADVSVGTEMEKQVAELLCLREHRRLPHSVDSASIDTVLEANNMMQFNSYSSLFVRFAPHKRNIWLLQIRMEQLSTFYEIQSKPAFIINLDSCTDRYSCVVTRAEGAGYSDVRRWRASDGNCETFGEAWKEMRLPTPGPDMRRAEQGCLLSHIRLWQHMLDEGIEVATVFEDDILFHPRFLELADKFYKLTPTDYDLLYLGSENHPDWLYGNIPGFIFREVDQLPVCCTHAYVITRTGAQRLLKLFRESTAVIAIDLVLLETMRKHVLKEADAGFVWYTWQATQHPCDEFAAMHHRWRTKAAGLVAQDYQFGSIISPHVYASTKRPVRRR